jgi:hypothetical protein
MTEKHYPNYCKALFLMLLTAFLLPLGAESGCLLDADELNMASGPVNVTICLDGGDERQLEITHTGLIGVVGLSGEDAVDGDFEAILSGLNELPYPVTTTGTGMISATLIGNVLTVSGFFSGLSSDFDLNVAGGAHLHLGMAGMGGAIAFPLTTDLNDDLRGGTFNAADNTFEVTTEQAVALVARGIYVNIHTVDFGGGELRGQLVPSGADDYNVAYLLGANETPAVRTSATGAVILERTGNNIVVTGSFGGLMGGIATDIAGGAHVHLGVAGRNGPVAISLSLTIGDDMTSAVLLADDNSFELTPEQAAAFDNGGLYVNIHSNAVRSGELRGQVLDMTVTQFYSNPSGHQTRPMAINTPGNGRLLMTLDADNNLVVSGSVNDLQGTVDLNIAGGTHIHEALAGSSGPIAFGLTITLDDDGGIWEPANNTFPLTDEEVEAFYARRYYVNVHTTAEASGEVRGQVMNIAKAYFGSNLAGLNANPSAIKTTGGGFLMYEGSDGKIVVTGSFAGLESNFNINVAGGSHIHTGNVTTTGGIVARMNVALAADLRSGSYEAADNMFMLDSVSFSAMLAGGYYFNLHTVDNPSGEIRGQILRDDNAFPSASEIISPENGATITVFEGGSDLEGGRFFSASDLNNDTLLYAVEIVLPSDTGFTSIIACEKSGTDTSSNTTIDIVYEVLISFGAGVGSVIPLRYRVLSLDGSVSTFGESRAITLIIGEVQCEVTGGTLVLENGDTTATICGGDGIPDPFNVVLTDTTGTDSFTYLVVSSAGVILGTPAGQPFDFDGGGGGARTLYAVSHDGTLTGAVENGMFANLGGCFALSNPIVITRLAVSDCGGSVFQAELSGLNELPCPVTTTGRGMVFASLVGNTLTVSGSFSDLTSDFDANVAGGAHLHLGMAGMGGGIISLLTADVDDDLRGGSFNAADNVFTLDSAQVAALEARGIYINIHTTDFGSGELRGQLVPAGADRYKVAYLLGVNEVPAVVTPASGALILERYGRVFTVSGSFSGLMDTIATDILGGAHIHLGVAGRNGSVIIQLNLTIGDDMTSAVLLSENNIYVMSIAQVAAFDNGEFYVNIHSNAVRSGELRGQVLDMAVTQFYSNPSGHQARPMAINTPGNGRLLMSLDAENNLVVSGSVNDLQGPVDLNIAGGSHVHEGLAGASGPVAFGLAITPDPDGNGGIWEPANNTFALTAEEVENFYARRYYVNVHTTAEASGEVRGQVMNLAKAYFGSNLAGINANPEAIKTTGGGFVMYEACNDKIVVTGSFAGLESDFAANIAGGSHIHAGDATATGEIVASLNVAVADDLRSGAYEAANNMFTLDAAGFAAMAAGDYYFNLHTVDNPSGEIRGQILRDDNAFPTTSEIISPEEGARVRVFEGGSDLEDGRFSSATDPNNDTLVYIVEVTLAGDTAFTTILACEKSSGDTSSVTAIDVVYQTLIGFGAVLGTEVSLRYRVVASDGSVSVSGGSRTITLVIGEEFECDIMPGTLALTDGSTTDTICALDGTLDPFNVVLTDTTGTDAFTYLVVSDAGVILGTPADQPFDFEAAGGGACTLYAVSHDGTLSGAVRDSLFENLSGCFVLSNPIVVTRFTGDDCGSRRVVINEVDRDGTVELLNLSRFNIDAGALYLASNDQFFLVSNLTVLCGNLLLKPGEQVTVDASGFITAEGDELGLLTRMTFTPIENLISYLNWGENDQMFEGIAVGLGLWTEATELGAPNSAVSIQRVLTQDNVYALGAPTPCAPNSLTTGTNQPAADRVSVFPNPFGDVLILEVSGLRSGQTELQLLDVNGRLILTRQLNQTDGRIELPTSKLAAGTYLLRLANEVGVSAVRVIHR